MQKTQQHLYHKNHKKSAMKALENIEKENGKLSKEIIEKCDSYAINYLGDIKYAPWLYVYSAMQGQFKEGWIPDNYYGYIIVKDIKGEFAKPSNLKPLSNRILNTKKLPDLLYFNNNLFITPHDYKVLSPNEVFETLFSEHDNVIFKANSSSQGKGVTFYSKRNWDTDKVKLNSGVFQKIIKQHSFFDNLFPVPGATIRITTALDSVGKATARAAYLRLGRSDDGSKSTHVQCSSEVKIAIHLDSGELFSKGYLSDWSGINYHPDTEVEFKGLIIPSFKEALIEVENLHEQYPFVECIGWDVSINTENEIEVMEWNAAHNDIKFSEAMHGPCFSDLLSYTKINK